LHGIGKEIVVALATGLYAGYIPVASGTFGTVVAIPLCFLLSLFGPLEGIVFVGIFVGIAIWISGQAEKIFQKKDSGLIVIDEMAGFLVTLYYIPLTLENLIAGFLLFRIMDIAKPFPIRRLEAGLPGGWGVVGDDVLAGVYANVVLRVIMPFWT
jgi:phosphatidylglycerophosphatase A